MKRPPYVFDTSALIELEEILPIWNLPPPPGSEIDMERFRHRDWLESGKATDLKEDEYQFFKSLLEQRRPKVHEGEAAAITIVYHRGGTLVIHEKAIAKARYYGLRCLKAEKFIEEYFGN